MIDNRLRPFFILVVPIGVAVAGFVVPCLVALEKISVSLANGKPDQIVFAEIAARWWVATTSVLLLAVALGAVFGAAQIARGDATTRHYRRHAFWIFVILALIGVVFLGAFGRTAYDDLGRTLFENTIGAYPDAAAGKVALARLGQLVTLTDIATLVAGTAIAVAAVILVPPVQPTAQGTPAVIDRGLVEENARQLARQIQHLKLLLFLSAVVLVAALVQAETWRAWPKAYWPKATDAAPFLDAVRATVSFRAAFYVVVLAAIFVPPAIRMRNAARSLAEKHSGLGDEAARQRWLAESGLALSFGEQAKRVLAIVAPFLVVAASALFDKLVTLWPALFGPSTS